MKNNRDFFPVGITTPTTPLPEIKTVVPTGKTSLFFNWNFITLHNVMPAMTNNFP